MVLTAPKQRIHQASQNSCQAWCVNILTDFFFLNLPLMTKLLICSGDMFIMYLGERKKKNFHDLSIKLQGNLDNDEDLCRSLLVTANMTTAGSAESQSV